MPGIYSYWINSVIWLLDVVGYPTFHHNTLWQEYQLHTVKLLNFTLNANIDSCPRNPPMPNLPGLLPPVPHRHRRDPCRDDVHQASPTSLLWKIRSLTIFMAFFLSSESRCGAEGRPPDTMRKNRTVLESDLAWHPAPPASSSVLDQTKTIEPVPCHQSR
jgi:hypothetical protein